MGPQGTATSVTSTPAVEPPPVAQPVQAVTPPAAAVESASPPAVPPPDNNPQWLPERLAQAKRTATTELLQALGVKDADELKSRLGELDTLKKASMTESERREAELAELKPKVAKVEQYETIIKARVTAELADLTDEQRQAVEALAGTDPAKTLATIDALKPTWVKAAPVAAPQSQEAPATPAAKPTPAAPNTNTAPARGTAPAETHQSPPDHKAVWEQLEKTNPFKAAAYLRQHKAEIFPSGS